MELKLYQQKTLKAVKDFLEALGQVNDEVKKLKDSPLARSIEVSKAAWEKVSDNWYYQKKNGLGEDVPSFYLKVPTSGGKTFLACHAIDLINKSYLKKQTGLVLWIVPTNQIYRQTFEALKNREHPYRQVLDISSGGRTMILEKTDRFTKQDIEERLAIMLLMLPSANRLNKDTLRMFQDNGGFTDFFPNEDDIKGNERLLNAFPNLDTFGDKDGFYGKTVKTSLGNVLRTIKPIVIIDEGHKAYSDTAQDTIRNFNPSIIMELSATPPEKSNRLVNITGQELNEEEMIKLDLHITNKTSTDWKNTLMAAVEQTDKLKKVSMEYDANTGVYIRPICLIQVERTGNEQKGKAFIHAEDAKDFLVKKCSVPEAHIAIKSSEKDDIEGIDLLSRTCSIRYIITKHALQEGWDCPFAYVLAVLTNPSSELSITQLVGRILRQPYARKTKVKALDESYVYCFRPHATDILKSVKDGLEDEGLGDIAGRVSVDSGEDAPETTKSVSVRYRKSFQKFEGKIYLPKFVIQDEETWRDVSYDMDIVQRIDWTAVDITALKDVTLSETETKEEVVTLTIAKEGSEEVFTEAEHTRKRTGLSIDYAFLTRQIIDVVPNPWIAHEIGRKAIAAFKRKHDEKMVASNFVFIIEELKKVLEAERDRLAQEVFRDLLAKKKLHFFLLTDKGGYLLPSRISIKSNAKKLTKEDHSPIEKSLFDYVAEDSINETERAVALYLDNQEKLLWWYRNISRQDYFVQGWKKHKIYPDFLVAVMDKKDGKNYSKVHVVETKGLHLKNEDTDYKKDVFSLCNKYGTSKDWRDLQMEFGDKEIEFQVIFEDEWRSRINDIVSNK